MTREEIISGLKFTVEMFLLDPNTGETYTEPRNDMDKTTIDACKGAIELLEQEPILDKIKTDIAKFADTIPFVSGDIKAKHANIGQHDGLEQALEIIEGNIKGDFDIDEWMAENE